MTNRPSWWLAAGLAMVCSACAGQMQRLPASPGVPVAHFPSKSELGGLKASEAGVRPQLPTIEVDAWRLETPAPEPTAPHPELGRFDRVILEYAGQRSTIRPSATLACAANETARFYVEHGGYPSDGVRRYLAQRCGSTIPNLQVGAVNVDAPPRAADADVERSLAVPLTEMLNRIVTLGDTELGVGFARGNGRAVVVMYAGVPRAHLDGFKPIATGNGITLEGQITSEAEVVFGLANDGRFGVRLCESETTLALPRFRIFCPLALNDQETRIQLVSRKQQQVLFEIAAEAMIRKSPQAALEYNPLAYGSPAPVADGAGFRDALYAGINEVRLAAGLKSMKIEAAQADVVQRLAPHMLRPTFGGSSEHADRVALGMIAGWDVEGTIREGRILAGASYSRTVPGRWLTFALEAPMGRWVLLDSAAQSFAIGVGEFEPSGALGVVTTYSFFEGEDHAAEEARVLSELMLRRVALKKRYPRQLPTSPALKSALERVRVERISGQSALADAVRSIMSERGQSVHGWSLETHDLQRIPWPPELVTPDQLEIEFGIAHYKPKDGAWGQYVVLFVIHQAGTLQAQRSDAHSKF